eukprot:TRINITY_DN23043_c0_g1_i1.p1 TRINITY_DN23043_c0_g1~~TRINITY_DN23043_c0_g1_i1.p1  ORF type:complete len:238 (+),score=71.93 TRINITY_DN23043_c0_g1_i1:100-813(+)
MRAWGNKERSRAEPSERSRSPPAARRRGKGGGGPPPGGFGFPFAFPMPGVFGPPPVVAPPAYDGSAKGSWSTWDVYFGKAAAPPAYDGMAQPGKGPDPLGAYLAQQQQQPMMPPMAFGMPPGLGYGKGAPHLPAFLGGESKGKPPRGKVGGKGKGRGDGRGGQRGDREPPSAASLDSQLDKYFSAEGADSGNNAKERVARFNQGKKDAPSEAALDEALAAYMSKPAEKDGEEEKKEA